MEFFIYFSICHNFQELEKDPHQPEYSKVANHFLENYKFPVMMMVALPNGTILHKVNANEFMDEGADVDTEPSLFSTLAGTFGYVNKDTKVLDKFEKKII